MKKNRTLKMGMASLLLGGLPLAAIACPGLTVEAPWIQEPPPGARVLAGFAALVNNGSAPVVIDKVDSPQFVHVMMHESRLENGIARMVPHATLVVPPGGRVTLAPGGLHLMLHEPKRAPAAGQTLPIALHCGGNEVSADFEIRSEAP